MTEIKIDKIIRSQRKTVALEITSDASLVVRAPRHTSLDHIEEVVWSKRDWINRKQRAVREKLFLAAPKRFVSGEEFLYLGNAYPLLIIENVEKTLIFDGTFRLSRYHLAKAADIFSDWYRQTARWALTERTEHLAARYGLQYNKITITSARRRWGSCSDSGNLNFSWRLVMAPLQIIDYVVIHELAHLEEKNHSRRFWDKVRQMDPDYKQHRRWLRENTHLLAL